MNKVLTFTANHFDPHGPLTAVGTYCHTPDEDIAIEVYSNDFGELLYSQDAFLDYDDIKSVLGIDFAQNNGCIKVLYVNCEAVNGNK